MNNKTETIEVIERLQRRLVRAYSRAAIPYVIVVALLLVFLIIAGREVEHNLQTIESWISELGPWGLLAFILFFLVATSFLIPDTVLCIIAGALFGLGWGAAAVLAGALLAAAIQFTLAHKLLHKRIEHLVASKPSLAAVQAAVVQDELRLQLLLRLTPLNPALINYLLGTAGVRFSGFIVASLALAPSLFLEVYFGYAGKNAARLSGSASATGGLQDVLLFGGLAVCIVVMIIISKMARKALMRAVAKVEAGRQPNPDPAGSNTWSRGF